VKEKEIMQSNIRYVDGIEVDITETVPAPSPRDTEKRLKLINAIVKNEIHSNKLLKVYDLKFNQIKTQKEMTEELGINRTTLAMQEKKLIEILQGIDSIRDILAVPIFPANNVPNKSSVPSVKSLMIKLSGPCNILDRFDRVSAMKDRDKRKETKLYKHRSNIPDAYKELTAEQRKEQSKLSRAILKYNRIKELNLTPVEKALELIKQGIDKLNIKSIPYKVKDFKDMVEQAGLEELNLLNREYTAWIDRHPMAC